MDANLTGNYAGARVFVTAQENTRNQYLPPFDDVISQPHLRGFFSIRRRNFFNVRGKARLGESLVIVKRKQIVAVG